VGRFGLKAGRRMVGLVGLGTATLCIGATIFSTSGTWCLIFLSLAYGGMTLQQPNVAAVALDIGRSHAGVIYGFGNTAAQAGGFISSIVFGYLVQHFGTYNAPLIPMVATLALGTFLWTRLDATREIFPPAEGPVGSAG